MRNNTSFSVVRCLSSSEPSTISVVSTVVRMVLVFPLSFYVVFLAVRQCRRRPCSSATPTSHSDFFTLHSISLQLVMVLGMSVYFSGHCRRDEVLVSIGFYCSTMVHCLEMLVHCFTCVDRYLAVVHPVTYLRLKAANGTRARNTAMVCAWLLSLAYVSVLSINPNHMTIMFLSLLGVNLSIMCFCSISVLCVLIRPGPSDAERVDHLKRKAFNTIMAIMAVLLFWLVGIFLCMVLIYADFLDNAQKCAAFFTVLAFNTPSDLVLPVLYLKRKGKIPCCKK